MIESPMKKLWVLPEKTSPLFSDAEFTEHMGLQLENYLYSRGGIRNVLMERVQQYLHQCKSLIPDTRHDADTIRFNLLLWFAELEEKYPGWYAPSNMFYLRGIVPPLELPTYITEFRKWYPNIHPQLRMTIVYRPRDGEYLLYVADEQGVQGEPIKFHKDYTLSLETLYIISMVRHGNGREFSDFIVSKKFPQAGVEEIIVAENDVNGWHPYQRRIKEFHL